MYLPLILIVELMLLAELMRRIDRMSATLFCSLYIIMGQIHIAYQAATFNKSSFKVWSKGEFYFHTDKWLLFFFGIFVIIYLSTLGLRNRARQSSVRAEMRKLLNLPFFRHAYLILFVLLVIRFLTIDLDVLWKNNQYLLINSADALTVNNGVTRFVKTLTVMGMMLAASTLGADIVAGRKLRVTVGLLLISIALLFPLASASRSAVLPPAAIALSLLALGNRRHVAPAIVFTLMAALFFIVAQIARATGEFGISKIPYFLSLIWVISWENLYLFTVASVAQGFEITPESMTLHATSYPLDYKLLSFSPFPSFIDGFSTIKSQGEVRLHAYVPMSAVGEAYHFGWPYMLVYALTIVAALRANILAADKNNRILFIATSLMITAMFISGFAYPVRNVYRNLLFILIILRARAIFLPILLLFVGKRPAPRRLPRDRSPSALSTADANHPRAQSQRTIAP